MRDIRRVSGRLALPDILAAQRSSAGSAISQTHAHAAASNNARKTLWPDLTRPRDRG
ncbi:hypothetical protein [Granulicella rosea]|uniref:hypothetical protein n=1 Tax=Granulicella rosea TaxID=474952 RepID=UPI001595D293|nr:hypothetical protein [Granulicella rosea]